ncbi:MAG TPA: M20/M25/M40 family metallo-hydrolase [Pseudorhodoplanes sp.]|nr:M20/M25/M40 family metallo-hydrolase [Pseudorhodoplanes sp.]
MGDRSARQKLAAILESHRGTLIRLCSELTAADSQNPPGDTSKAADLCVSFLKAVPGVEARKIVGKEPVANVLARLAGQAGEGRRLVFNGHLDTGLVPEADRWSVPPFGGVVRDNRIYGRGVADMKAGIAAQLVAVAALAAVRDSLRGEVVLTLVGDEGTGAKWGTLYLLDRFPQAQGDAMISGDVGSPLVARFGEKGFLWLEIVARGKSAGGAHAYLGINAIDRLTDALEHVRALEAYDCRLSPDIAQAIDVAAPISERLHGKGETRALKSVSVNVGMIEGGRRINAVPSIASARVDIRFPAGVTSDDLLRTLDKRLAAVPDVEVRVLDRAEPNWTEPGAEIVQLLRKNATEVMGRAPVLSTRLGFSDARHYRERGVASIGYGATAHNGNAPDEYVEIEDLVILLRTYGLTAFDYLNA